jgi:hypothetical protein
MATPLTLPRAADAEIEAAKLRDYVLDPDHSKGRHKARVFRSALGIAQDDWEFLCGQILERLPNSHVTSVAAAAPWGFLYEVVVMIDGLNGATHPVITAWMVEGDGAPRLVSAYVETRS